MKNIKKASVVSVLSLALAIPLTASAAATTDVAPATTDPAVVSQSVNTSTDVTTPTAGEHEIEITPYSTQPGFDTTLGGQQTVSYFSIPAGMGYVKIWVKNTGSEAIKFALHKGSASGSVVKDATIPKGSTFEWISSSALSTGDFYATFNTSNTNMQGQAYGKLASSRNEL